MKPRQLSFWDMDRHEDEYVKSEPKPDWYYIRNLRDDTMLVTDLKGYWTWVDHDTIHNTPHLYSKRALAAQEVARRGVGSVAIYRWRP